MKKVSRRKIRQFRVRKRIKTGGKLPRLSVFRSNKNIYAQIIDDNLGKTITQASSLRSPKSKGEESKTSKLAISGLTGERLAKEALKKNIKNIVFDRGGYKYHGRVKALAEGARKVGLKF